MQKSISFLLFVLLAIPAHSKELLLTNGAVDIQKTKGSFKNLDHRQAQGEYAFNEFFIIQFKNTIQPSDQEILKSKGIEIVRYIPDDAYLVKAKTSDILILTATSKSLYDVTPFLPTWKLSPEFGRLSVFDQSQNEVINVRLLPGTDLDKIKIALGQIPSLEIISFTAYELVVKAPRAAAFDLSAIEGAEWIQLQPKLETFDFLDFKEDSVAEAPPSLTGYESGTKVMKFDSAWAQGFRGQNQTVAMADTGLDTGNLSDLHQDLQTVKAGIPMGLFSNSWADPQGHGTHVAGSVVGTGRMSQGQIRGGAYAANFVAVSIWSDLFGNISIPPQFQTVFQKPYDTGARIHTNSWGSAANLGGYDNFAAQVDQFMWDHPDMLVVFAAGNSGQDSNKDGVVDENSIGSPGTAKNTLTVGASENLLLEGGRQKSHVELKDGEKKWGAEPIRSDKLSNNEGGIAVFSSRGPTKDGRIKPDIVAPGTNIVSLRSRDPRATTLLWGEYNEHYVYAGGTSMATPLTAGAAAVTRQVLVEKLQQTNPSAALVKAALVHTAVDLFPGQYGVGPTQEIPKPAPNNQEGYGRVDMDSVTYLDPIILDDNKVGIGAGEVKTYSLEASTGAIIRVNLAYTDYPASAAVQKTLVNDLDVEIIAPNGDIHSISDRVNNMEMVLLNSAVRGTYQIHVKGINVPQGQNGKQPYALIASLAKGAN